MGQNEGDRRKQEAEEKPRTAMRTYFPRPWHIAHLVYSGHLVKVGQQMNECMKAELIWIDKLG